MGRTGLVGGIRLAVCIGILVAAAAPQANADTVSYTGTLANPQDSFVTTASVASDGTLTLQTFGFGGGLNAAGATIDPGGFDPFVGLFSGTGDSAVFVDGTSDIVTNFTPGCPPAGTVTIGSFGGQCGDVNLQFTGLAAGTYTVLLTDGDYLPNALFEDPGGTLGDDFSDLTGGVLQTCVDENNCNTDTASWALDVTTGIGSSAPAPTPEPPSVELAGIGMIGVVAWMYSSKNKLVKEAGEGCSDAIV